MLGEEKYFEEAFTLARKALSIGEVPVGCVLVYENVIIGRGHNRVNFYKNACRHAEMEAFDEAFLWCKTNCLSFDDVFLKTTLFVTCEPCMMCAALICKMKLKRVVYGCPNDRFGGFGSVLDVKETFGHTFPSEIVANCRKDESVELLQIFYENGAINKVIMDNEAVLNSVPEKDVLQCVSAMQDPHHRCMNPPSPLITKRDRRPSLCERAALGPVHHGRVRYFCRERGHGYITPLDQQGGEDIFVHISDVEGDYAPHDGDEVTYKLCPIPPKFEKMQAVHVVLRNLVPGVKHERWDQPISHPCHAADSSHP
ncbi:tRNA-specific adenosine deaminase 2 [Trichinella pseudospiralis]|uniref:tRNA-specific adenosine deaminase 2 n=1 Tax=Trichinella pseudospiralis TaxID=6337 RepID=A0A0V1FDJ8_TRIPS|nr:tRNA-specific adenosine deaminase 2 [Trichinella pseudospiralis]